MDAAGQAQVTSPVQGARRHFFVAGAAALLVAAVFALYRGVLHAPFILDDVSSVQNNLSIRQLWPPENATVGGTRGRPIANASFALDYAVGGNRLAAYHASSIALHAIAALVLFGLIRRTLRLPVFQEAWGGQADLVAASAALMWAVHPLQTEAVIYIAQRTEVLMALCYLLTLYCFVRAVTAERNERTWLALALLAAFAGAAAKEVMVTAPVAVLLFDRAFVSGSWRAALRARPRFYLALAASWLVLASLMFSLGARGVGAGLGVTPFSYAVSECSVVLKYLRLAVWPAPLVFDYGSSLAQSPVAAWSGVVVMAVLGGAVISLLYHRPIMGFLAAWPLLILAPTSSVVPIALQPMAEHRMYLPLAGLALLAVLLLWRTMGEKIWIAVLLISLALWAATLRRNETYASAIELWRDTTEKCPSNERAQVQLAVAYLRANRLAEARVPLLRALALNPQNASALINLGVLCDREGRSAEAIAHLRLAVQLDPTSADAYYDLGSMLLKTGSAQEGGKALVQAILINPDHSEAHDILGTLLASMGNHRAAIGHFTQALRTNPRDPEIYANRGDAYAQIGQNHSALADYQTALELRPDDKSIRAKIEALRSNPGK